MTGAVFQPFSAWKARQCLSFSPCKLMSSLTATPKTVTRPTLTNAARPATFTVDALKKIFAEVEQYH